MTMDDENSIYVGGLPYECTESQLRRVFELYGSVVAVKITAAYNYLSAHKAHIRGGELIINDRGVGGKCYGFVTFTNPRSAAEAIEEMDGRTIGGRVVRVNEVKSRGAGGRSNYGREKFRRNERELDWDKGRDRERDSDYGRERPRDHSREHGGERERRYDHTYDPDQARDFVHGRDRDKGRDEEEWEQDYDRTRDQEWERDDDFETAEDRRLDRDDDHDRRGEENKDQYIKRKTSYDRHSRELSSESSDYYHQVEEQLDSLIKRREELRKEKSDMEQRLEEKKQLIVDLQKKSMKLEDALTSSKKLSSKRQMQLNKLHKCFQQVKEYGEKLKTSEQDLQDLVNSVTMEIDADGDLGVTDVYVTNGKDRNAKKLCWVFGF
ncbi:hypothetical protein Cgig2_018606 [Carnegiea gigantea]|uniref:RRM domain-containing protein n=1 Tax=Carnegiea gigantea TaxID=171969 RepID=A0A9Q1QJD1_9CARY|nr:hypothetical protein Cgig2_018606 [Carnegiea gigantea]